MVKDSQISRKNGSHKLRAAPYATASSNRNIADDLFIKKSSDASDKKDWLDATCSVCMESPHNAVLLLCSSYGKGCRPYMCNTSYRYSNCLEQYKKAYAKENKLELQHDTSEMPSDALDLLMEKSGIIKLACPLCRGQVKGWTVVEPARQYLNSKKRNCMQDTCTFVGTYKELRNHVRAEHPCSRPRDVDPEDEQRWKQFMQQQERNDAISYVRSRMPGARVVGDYVIEGNPHGSDREETEFNPNHPDFASHLMNLVLLLHSFGPPRSDGRRGRREHLERVSQSVAALFGRSDISELGNGRDSNDANAEDGNSRSEQGREISGGPGRRRRHRASYRNQR